MSEDYILDQDIEDIADMTDREDLKGARILVTGATGLIGSMTVKALSRANEKYGLGMRVFAVVRNAEKAKKIFEGYKNIEFIVQDICEEIKYHGPVNYVIHCAGATGSKDFVEKPADVIRTTVHGCENMLEFSRRASVRGMLFLSTMEVYGNPDENFGKITEDRYAQLDHFKTRSSYPESKKLCETMCLAYASQYNVPVKVARLTQTFGAGVDYNDGRVFAEFVRCIIEEKDIVLHTKGDTVRDYCYVSDAVRAMLMILFKGSAGECYNVANTATLCSIKEMAELAADISGKISVRTEIAGDISAFGYAPTLYMDLDTSKLEGLGWKPEYDLREMFIRTKESMTAGA